MSPNAENTPCIPLDTLQEYAVQYVRRGLKLSEEALCHFEKCANCRNTFGTLGEEAREMAAILVDAPALPQEECPINLIMAQYLDKSLTPDAMVAFEQHLSECARCRHTLVEMYRDLQITLAEVREGVPLSETVSFLQEKVARIDENNTSSTPVEEKVSSPSEDSQQEFEQRKKRYLSESS